MEHAIKGIEKAALRQSKIALRLWAECKQILEAADRGTNVAAVSAALELNKRAIDQAREAVNRFDFVRRYRSAPKRTLDEAGESRRTGTSSRDRDRRERPPRDLHLK